MLMPLGRLRAPVERRLVGVCWEHRLGLAGRGPGCVSSAQGLGA